MMLHRINAKIVISQRFTLIKSMFRTRAAIGSSSRTSAAPTVIPSCWKSKDFSQVGLSVRLPERISTKGNWNSFLIRFFAFTFCSNETSDREVLGELPQNCFVSSYLLRRTLKWLFVAQCCLKCFSLLFNYLERTFEMRLSGGRYGSWGDLKSQSCSGWGATWHNPSWETAMLWFTSFFRVAGF